MKKKESKSKKYSLINNYLYLFGETFRFSKWNVFYTISGILADLASVYLGIYIPKLLIQLVIEKVSIPTLLMKLATASVFAILLRVMLNQSGMRRRNGLLIMRHYFQEKILKKINKTAYSNLEDPAYRGKVDRSRELYEHWSRDVCSCIEYAEWAFILLLQILISSTALFTLHPIVVVTLIVCAMLRNKVNGKQLEWEIKNRDKWQMTDLKSQYIIDKTGDLEYGKEIRLYHATDWLMPKFRNLMKERLGWIKKQQHVEMIWGTLMHTISYVGQGVVYGFLLWNTVKGRISGDNFVLYSGLALNMSGALEDIVDVLRSVRANEISIADYREILNLKDPGEQENAEVFSITKGRAPEICFSHVSFSYPGAEKETLSDVNLTIRAGEKLALVGLNGAGKTTLIKLLCGMYEPTKGEIFIDGHALSKSQRVCWYQQFSVVFQDLDLFPATIAENVSCVSLEDPAAHHLYKDKIEQFELGTQKEEIKKNVQECLIQSDLWEMVQKLPNGMDTYLHKEMFAGGVNLSGGEMQKLLLARAIYKEAPILILDEPTAALDAIAENQLYLRYNKLTEGRTSLYISHRLSSTRFCDRILMLENGKITEDGSHEELMQKEGAYYQLYQVQSHYYQEDRTEEFSSLIDPTWEVSSYVSK